ncbi:subtilase-type protease inhibitor [Streptomyces sp. JJ36]|uniref:subtilase-type protease inhibitor n=1 Tax=Streptomyces sp. JJ36 TaxID=2736645 RepID=UPI001F2BC804|nr:subtilase-type protease inhibitor [Streptomyces sp. JJ36]MCF6526522.1 subtilase-type protease inhibitor [Streptomyces sp. JJ36]
MRHPVRLSAVIPLLTAGTLLGLSGTATAAPTAPTAPDSLYAPSALTLTVAEGTDAATATPQRAVTLSCTPTPTGTHPDPAAACARLRAVNGDFAVLGDEATGTACPMIYDPVVVTAQGVWEGKRVSYERTYANSCVRSAEGTAVFAF